MPDCSEPDHRPVPEASIAAAPAACPGRRPAAGAGRARDRRQNGRHSLQDISFGQARIVIEKEEQLTRHQWHPGVTPGQFPRFRAAPARVRLAAGRLAASRCQPPQRRFAPLGEQGLQGAVKIIWPLALGEDDDAEPRLHYRSRDEVRTATRWPTTVRPAAATRPASSALVAKPPRNRSSTAATKINNESSTEWNTR